jgi:integrase
MKDRIKVHVVDYGRECFYMRYVDPVTKKQVTRSTDVKRSTRNAKREAAKVAAKWESELQEGRYKSPLKVTWDEFRQRYEDEVLPSLAEKTGAKVDATFNAVETHVGPQLLSALNSEAISTLQSKLRDAGRSESTIKGHMRHLLASLNWAKDVGMIHEVPKARMPQRAKKSGKTSPMKGRPITGEEFDRLLAKVPDVVGNRAAESWCHFIRGLWWSGLRLEESLSLYWDRDDMLCVDLGGKYPMLRIPAELEKGNTDRLLPIAPEFAEFLLATPESERTGRVFNPRALQRRDGQAPTPDRIGRVISEIGRKAGVKVLTDQRTGKVKHASCHDLRRSFGERWAVRVMPQVLMQLMRHESIDTTLRFYVGRNAETTAEALYRALGAAPGNSSGNTCSSEPMETEDSAESQVRGWADA